MKKKRDPWLDAFNNCTDGQSIPDLVMMSRETADMLCRRKKITIPVYDGDGKLAFWLGKRRSGKDRRKS